MTTLKRPLKKDFCKSFSLDDSLVSYDAKAHAKALNLYIENLLMEFARIEEEARKQNTSTIIGICAEILDSQ